MFKAYLVAAAASFLVAGLMFYGTFNREWYHDDLYLASLKDCWVVLFIGVIQLIWARRRHLETIGAPKSKILVMTSWSMFILLCLMIIQLIGCIATSLAEAVNVTN